MKRIIFAAMFIVTLTVAGTCAAQDVWVDRYTDGTDVYVMDDTIRETSSDNGKFLTVSVKEIRNGQAPKVATWYFTRRSDSNKWYYSMRRLGGESVLSHNKIFEFCMKEVGWSYTTDGNYYY